MDDRKFNEIADSVIQPIGDRLVSHTEGIAWLPFWKESLAREYDEIRLHIRGQMFNEPDTMAHRIDRHKVAAAFTKGIMKVKPLRLKAGVENPSPGARLANEMLAFLVAVRVVQQFLVRRFKELPEWNEKLATASFIFPPANEVKYPEHIYKAFFNADCNGLNVFVLANLYFLIESHHLHSLGCPNLPVPPEGTAQLSGLI
jgi:hypothetical protein